MESQVEPGPASVVLAHLPHKGLIRQCHSGCIHVTFGCVTLDFHEPQFYAALVEAVRSRAGALETGVQVRHGNAVLCLSCEEFAEFGELVNRAERELRQLEVVRRLVSGESLPRRRRGELS